MQTVREILNHYDIYFEQHPAKPREVLYLCPFHEDHNVGSASFNEDTLLYNCFACNTGGNAYQFVAAMEQCSVKQAAILINNDFRESATYSLTDLKAKLSQEKTPPGITSDEVRQLIHATIQRVLEKCSVEKVPLPFYCRALRLCTWLSSREIKDDSLESYRKAILNFYDQFLVQLKQQRSHNDTEPSGCSE